MNSNNRKKDNAVRGMFLTLVGGTLWGFSGTCGQFLMQTKGVTSNWLVPIRLLLAGALLLFICWLKDGRGIFRIWIQDASLHWNNPRQTVLFAQLQTHPVHRCW